MSTPHPSQQPWAVPATQNTAPVIKFRCLYTYDLRRKAKRWQDGYLRFHTFNKRVMVYDATGNFIGDHHWRQDEPLQDGDELELDRGVLIQVCEPMEKTETDISAIYSHKKSQTSPFQAGDQSTPSIRPSTPVRSSILSQPTRSLNDLLGIKKTAPAGKLVSPYEERYGAKPSQKEQQTVERAPKRQRVDSSARPQQLDFPRPHRQPEVIDLSEPSRTTGYPRRGDSIPQRSANAVKPPSKAPSNPSSPAVPTKIVNNAVQRNANLVQNPSNPQQPPTVPSRSCPEAPATAKPPPSAAKVPLAGGPNPPSNSLRLSTSKPRKKLMYRDLLPGHGSARTSTTQVVDLTACDAHPAADYTPSASTMQALDAIDDESTPNHTRNCAPHTIKARTSLTGLRKAHSDPSPLFKAHIPPRSDSSNSPLNGDEDTTQQGPWTSEAQDLFDFWPPGRPKPT
ncbi:hypothetical protein ATEIFO6365_0012033800 [Aspergillus terreus]|uniref:5'-3' DNA helicase ZGRF1-like N-terminal domain-containing protein n=1 Tax=Aspergillus terreus TaxID=33178 RepID=A0A5M3ZC50_ASPTE|nr:hypothetical protein ATETN484_0013034800 [Aspergillus terreus]GFF20582.1 hypothetical protein ATEIFO6365_0012033800 [Aspergillus terreus]